MSVVYSYRAAAFALGLAFFCSLFSVDARADQVKVGDITIVDAWARATPAKAGGVFVTLRNDGDAPDRLIGVATAITPMANIHETQQDNGVMKMRPVDGVALPPHATVTLKPGGYHIMLMGLVAPLKAGDTFPLTLTFGRAGNATVTVTVKEAGATGSGMSMDHGSGQ